MFPFVDYIIDSWEKAKALGFGEGASVYNSVLVFGDLRVGGKTWIGPFFIFDGTGGSRLVRAALCPQACKSTATTT